MKKIPKWMRITLYSTIASILIVDFLLVGFSVHLAESERGPNETGRYFGCGQENNIERRLCPAWDAQKEIFKNITGQTTRFEATMQKRQHAIEYCVTSTGGPDLHCLQEYE